MSIDHTNGLLPGSEPFSAVPYVTTDNAHGSATTDSATTDSATTDSATAGIVGQNPIHAPDGDMASMHGGVPGGSSGAPSIEFIEFRVSRKDAPVRRLRLTGNRYTFGSAEGCSIRLNDPNLRPMHAVLMRDETQVVIRGYAVPVEVNGRRMMESTLNLGDRLVLGEYQFELLSIKTSNPWSPDPNLSSRRHQGSLIGRQGQSVAGHGDQTTGATSHGSAQPESLLDDADETVWRNRLRKEIDQWRNRQAECDQRENRCDEREAHLRGRESELWSRAENLYRREAQVQGQVTEVHQLHDEYSQRQEELLRLRDQATGQQRAFKQRESEFIQQEFEYREKLEVANAHLLQSQAQAQAATDAVQQMRVQFDALNEQIEELSSQQGRLKQHEENERDQNQQMRGELEEQRDLAIDAKAESEALRCAAEARVEEMAAELESLRSNEGESVLKQASELEENEATIAELRRQIETLQATVDAASEEAVQVRDDYRDALDSVRQLEELVQQSNQRGDRDREEWSTEADSLRAEIESLSADLDRTGTDLKTLREANETLTSRLEQVQNERDDAFKEISDRPTREAFDHLRDELETANDALTALKQELDSVELPSSPSPNSVGFGAAMIETDAAMDSVSVIEDRDPVDSRDSGEAESDLIESPDFYDKDEANNDADATIEASATNESIWNVPNMNVGVQTEYSAEKDELAEDLEQHQSLEQSDQSVGVAENETSDDDEVWPTYQTADASIDDQPEDIANVLTDSEEVADNESEDDSYRPADSIEQTGVWAPSDSAEAFSDEPDSDGGDEKKASELHSPWESEQEDKQEDKQEAEQDDDLNNAEDRPAADGSLASMLIADLDSETSDHQPEITSNAQNVDESASLEDSTESARSWDHEYPEENATEASSESVWDLANNNSDQVDETPSFVFEDQQETDKEEAAPEPWQSDQVDATAMMNDVEEINAFSTETKEPLDTPEFVASANDNDGESDSLAKESSVTTSDASDGDNDDDSIEAYMNRLLGRAQGETTSEAAVPPESLSLSTASVLPSTKTESGSSDHSVPITPDTSVDPDAPLVPRSHAPERNSDLSAMRELANQSARTAISKSTRLQTRNMQLAGVMNFGVAGLAILFAFGIPLLLSGGLLYLSWTMLIIIAAISVRDGMRNMTDARKRMQAAARGDIEDDASDERQRTEKMLAVPKKPNA